jgi:protein-tyrosine kinase
MSNIFEALQHAGSQMKQMEKSSDLGQVSAADTPSTNLELTMEPEMIDLYRHIEALLPDSPKMVLQFIGSRSGEGVSTIVREYAAMATARLGKSVLILDANQNERDQQHFFRITNNCGWDQAVCDPEAMDKAICRIGDSNLNVSGLSRRSTAIRQLFDACQIKNFFTGLKMRFDLVLVDSSPVTSGTDSTVLSRSADGVLLVVEADKTRWPAAENMKTKIQKSGGNILGLVFNKRRYYIPEYLYRRL